MTSADVALRYDRSADLQGKDSLSQIARLIAPRSTVLDLGAATGKLGLHLRDRKGCTVDGVELDVKAAALARPHYRKLLELNLDRERLADHFPSGSYDAIVCADVLEHLPDPGRVLDQLQAMLAPGGQLLISIPNVGYAAVVAELLSGEFRYRPTGLLDETHLRFFTRSSLLDLLAKHGFGAQDVLPLLLEPRHSEFGEAPFDRLPPSTANALLDAPDALAYQFIVVASPGPHAPGLAQLLQRPRPQFQVQLYWASAEGSFDERHSVSATVPMGDAAQRIELRIPTGSGSVDRLRLDIADRKGFIRLDGIAILSRAGEVLWRWNGDPAAFPVRTNLVVFNGPLGQTWLSTSDDPFLELPRLAANGHLDGGTVEIRLDWPASADYVLAAAAIREHDARADARRRLQQARLDKLEKALGADGRLDELVKQEREVLKRLELQLLVLSQRVQRLEAGSRLRRMLRSFRTNVLRPRIMFNAVASHGLSGGTEGVWESIGNDPHFELRPPRGRYPSGWVLVDFELRSEVPVITPPQLFVDAGQGYDPKNVVELPRPSAGRIRALIKLPPDVRAIRLDPLDRPGKFAIGTLAMQEIGKVEVALHGLARLGGDGPTGPRHVQAAAATALRLLRSRGLRGFSEELRDRARGVGTSDYQEWIAQFDTLSAYDIRAIQTRIGQLPRRPRFSVVMPVYETPERWLRRAIESVRDQLWPEWELCIADDASKSRHVRAVLEEAAASDPRIRVSFRKANGHISETSNTALALATGDFAVLLDHDDELPRHALYLLAEETLEHPETDLIYTDEDKIDERGRRYEPFFKPDWDPDLFTSQNYFSHLGAYRLSLVREVGGFRSGYEGSQDYDLALRCIQRSSRVRHVPFVLYHWRSIAGSTAAAAEAKSYALTSAQRALRDHLTKLEPSVEVETGPFPTLYRVRRPLRAEAPLASLLVPTRNAGDVLRRCIDSIYARTHYPRFELVIVDNQSEDPSTLRYLEELRHSGQARVVQYPHPFNYSAINNLAAREAKGEVLVLLNNDVEVITPEWLSELVANATRPGIGAVGARLLYPNGTVQHAGVVTGIYGVAGHVHRFLPRQAPGYFGRARVVHGVSVVTGACLAIRRSVYQELGGLDESNLAVAFNDVDFCLRLREAGYRNLYTPYAELYHYESYSRGADTAPEKRERFEREVAYMRRRWRAVLESDPSYNPNLSLSSETFELAWPPRVTKPWASGS